DRQLVEIDIIADQHDLARGRALHVFRWDWAADCGGELVLDLTVGLAAERYHRALTGTDEPGHHRHLVADHLVEIERGLRLVDQGGDVADVDRLVQVDQLAGLPQPGEGLAEIFLHLGAPRRGSDIRGRPAPPRDVPRPGVYTLRPP